MPRPSLKSRVVSGFAERLHDLRDAEAFLPEQSNYVTDWRKNLLPGVEPAHFEKELRAGDGTELDWKDDIPPKFSAAHSSSALAVNSFAPFKKNRSALLVAEVEGFDRIQFERKCPTGLARAAPPNLDVLLETESAVVAIESKCTEYLSPKTARFSKRYDQLVGTLFEPGPLAVYGALKADPKRFAMLDAAQLIKHYLGLRNSFGDRTISLLYLFWEPENVADIEAFQCHREEINEFGSHFASSEVTFRSMSYPELWKSWGRLDAPDWLRRHVDNLEDRYLIRV